MQEGDPALTAWILEWVTQALFRHPSQIFHGNAFYPDPASISLAEHLVGLAPLDGILRLVLPKPWASYNVLIFLAYLLSATGAYRLVAWVTRDRYAAYWGGLFWGFLFYRVHHVGHLQLLSFQWICYALFFLVRVVERARVRDALLLGTCFTLQALTSWYLAVVTGVLVALFALAEAGHGLLRRRTLALLGASGALVAALVAPFVPPYLARRDDSTLGARMAATRETRANVRLRDYLEPPESTLIGGLIPGEGPAIWGERTLYVGWSALLLSAAAPLALRRRAGERGPEDLDPGPRAATRHAVLAVACVVVGWVLARGFVTADGLHLLPLGWLARVATPIAAMRATQRFSLVLYAGVLLLSSLGLAALRVRLPAGLPRAALVLAASLVYAIEVFPVRLPFDRSRPFEYAETDRAIATWQQDEHRRLTVLHLPIHFVRVAYPIRDASYQLGSTLHWAQLVNGFSGETPTGFGDRMRLLDTLPSDLALAEAERLGVDVIALRADLEPERRAAILAWAHAAGHEVVGLRSQEELVRLRW